MTTSDQDMLQPTRRPKQKRSQDRVNAILESAAALIAQHGSAGLRIQDIARDAGFSAGSIYQYFENKDAIIERLAEAYMTELRALCLEAEAVHLQSVDEMLTLYSALWDKFYAFAVANPAFPDILLGVNLNKKLVYMEEQDTSETADILVAATRHLFPPHCEADVRNVTILTLQLSRETVRQALKSDAGSAATIVDIGKTGMRAMFRDIGQPGE